MPAAFWIVLTIGAISTAIPAYNSYDKNKDDQKEAIRKTALITICGVVATLTLAIAASFIYDWMKDKNTNSDVDESIPTIEIDSGDTSTSRQESVDYTLKGSETLLYQRLRDKVTEEILCFVSDDFDNDGKTEAFAIVGKEQDDVWKGCPFFINEVSVTKMISNTMAELEWDKVAYRQTFRKVPFGKQKAVVFSLWTNNSFRDEAYGIINGEPTQYYIPDVDGGFNVTDNFITLTVDAFDICCDENLNWEGGHTWKPYYFFWNDGLNSFSEYGGIEISIEQLNQLKDVSSLMNKYYEEGYSLLNIIYRANKIININYRKLDYTDNEGRSLYSHANVTLYLQNDSIYLSDKEILEENDGYYLTAIRPDIAVYPKFPY